jgi:aspartyl protease family protein
VGETFTSIKIFGPGGSAEHTSMVDTGATFTKIPKSVAEKVGTKTRRKVLVQLSTGGLIERDLGYFETELEGVRDIVPVTVASEDEPTVIGYSTLEILGFKVDPSRRKLEKTHPIEY